jgi:hypothetical protein
MIFVIILITFLLSTCLIKNINHDSICFICCFLLIKWILNYRKCTISYIECKFRGVKKEKGIIYNIMEEIYDVNKFKYRYIIYLFVLVVFYINFKNLKRIK